MSTSHSVNKNDDYEALQKQRETFVASLSHDLKNPTIAQIRAIELILKGKFGQILPEQREIMEMLLDSCKYMNAMLCSILTTYRCEKGKIELKIEKATIRDLAEECVNEMIFLATENDQGGTMLCATTSDLTEQLRHTLWTQPRPLLLTSATIAVGKDFAPFRKENGLADDKE